MITPLTAEVILLIVLTGFVSGYINTLAGSGSFITLPLLIFLGLPANVANGTNRIAIFLQTLTGLGSFYKQGQVKFRTDIKLAIPALFGAIPGAFIATDVNEQILEKTIGIIMLLMLVILLLKPKQFLLKHAEKLKRPPWYAYVVFFFIGLYAGFIQAGAGLFMLMGLSLSAGYDLVRGNAVKLLIILIYTPIVIYIFFVNEQVHLVAGLILAGGSMAGALLAARMAVKHGAKFVRYVLFAIMIISAGKLLFY